MTIDGNAFYQSLDQVPVLSSSEVIELYQEIDSGAPVLRVKAQEKMIKHNLRLVLSTCHKYNVSSSSFDDVFQEGVQGLMRAVEKFDPSLGFQFSTYATTWIRYKIERYLGRQSSAAYTPVEVMKMNSRVRRCKARLQAVLPDSEVTVDAIAKDLGESISDVRRSYLLLQPSVCLDAPIIDREGADGKTRQYFLDDSDSHTASVEKSILLKQMMDRIEKLPTREAEAIIRHYGLKGNEESYREIGEDMGVSYESVRLMIKRGIERLNYAIGAAVKGAEAA